jgi:hypothetical protein
MAAAEGLDYQCLAKRRRRARSGWPRGLRNRSHETSGRAPTRTAPEGGPSLVVAALNREWRREYEKTPAPTPLAWHDDGRLGSFDCIIDLLAELADSATPLLRTEELTAVLAQRAAAGDRHATRVLVQLLLPSCAWLAFARNRPHLGSRDRVLDELLTAAWDVVRTGVEPRGRATKLALLRTIEYRALRRPSLVCQRQAEREVLVLPEDIGSVDCSEARNINPGEEVVQLLVQATTVGLSHGDARLLGGLFVGGWTSEELGAQEGVTSRTIRYRRAEAIRRLALLST